MHLNVISAKAIIRNNIPSNKNLFRLPNASFWIQKKIINVIERGEVAQLSKLVLLLFTWNIDIAKILEWIPWVWLFIYLFFDKTMSLMVICRDRELKKNGDILQRCSSCLCCGVGTRGACGERVMSYAYVAFKGARSHLRCHITNCYYYYYY